ncbi:cupredoxin domain-containing protein [Paenibacillus monticola]|uniref:Cytochrome C oxidase subunit II n=1 Tax=Paenibacillus monticola TaxID=2666075 RepID=A0A7X2H9B6_9BACL|nr:cupredoxin domain-containing protein [Paenibacillus monticola]MRN55916.1 cytochrome C oxidase subunit II [Paenibacillus monticola]
MIKRAALLLSIVLVLLLAACSSGNNNKTAANSNGGVSNTSIAPEEEITIKATNYSFDQKEYHLKKGVPVKIIFENESGSHGILVPELNLQLNGEHSSEVIIPEEAGTYKMTCAVMCGSGHSEMIATVIVE